MSKPRLLISHVNNDDADNAVWNKLNAALKDKYEICADRLGPKPHCNWDKQCTL